MNAKELYIELQDKKYDERPYSRMKNWGDGMEIVEEVINGYWRERFLIDSEAKEAFQLMDAGLTLTFVSKEDINWEDVENLENNSNAYSFSAYYQRFDVGKFKNCVALVKWTLYPDGYYFMDEDGYGMRDNDESALYGFIDKKARVVVPFQAKDWTEMEKLRPEAEKRAKELTQNHNKTDYRMKHRVFNLIVLLLILLLSVSTAFADKKMTITNADTGESFEVTAPDGMRIYEYNSNWLDSIPYLMERAKYGEPWAYEALGDCYRYGNGGVEHSIFKALNFYELSGKNINEMTEEMVRENPMDHLSLIYRLFGKMEHDDRDAAICLLDTLKMEGYNDAEVLRNFLGDTIPDTISSLVNHNLISPEIGADELMFTILGCFTRDWLPDSIEGKDEILDNAATKFPCLYNDLGVRFLRNGHDDMDPTELEEKMAKAISYLEHADNEAVLSRQGAEILYAHYLWEIKEGRKAYDKEIMERLESLVRIDESEITIQTDEYE